MDRLNLSSTEASTRIGKAINRKYRLITTSIGLQLSRRVTVAEVVNIGSALVTFANAEKIIEVVNRGSSPHRTLREVTIEELRNRAPYGDGDAPSHYAIRSHTSNSVTIELNKQPTTAFTLHVDLHQTVADLSGTGEPAFPESFHDIVIEGVLSDELRKMEKPQLAAIAQREYERILSDLRMWIAKSNYMDVYQAKYQSGSSGSGGSGGGASVTMGGIMMRISLRA